VVEDEALVMTADPAELVHQGIGTDRWINITDSAAEKISTTLDSKTSGLAFVEMPLREVVQQISSQMDLAIVLDERALEEIGMTGDDPVLGSFGDVSLRSVMELILEPFDLTYTIAGESLLITTHEASENRLLNRIYWLEGTGLAAQDEQSVIDSIQTAFVPDTWEALGGPSTIAPVPSARPALLISTTYETHETIESYFETLRSTHLGEDPVLKPVAVPTSPPSGFHGFHPGMGGLGGGGGGGMM